MFYAIVIVSGELISYRSLASASDPLLQGEALWSGAMPTNPIWDATLSNGQGGIRQMTIEELQAELNEEISAATQKFADTSAIQTFYTLAQSNMPSINDLTTALCALIRVASLAPAPTSTTTTPATPGSPIAS